MFSNPSGLRTVRLGIVLSIFAIGFGFLLGGLFGAFEDTLKAGLNQQGQQVLATVYAGDTEKLQAVVNKSWSYFKRAHMHGGGIGTAALSLCLLLAWLPQSSRWWAKSILKRAASSALGLGAIGYSTFWLWAGWRAPAMGSTGAAKESLSGLAIPSAGLLLLGTFATLILVCLHLYLPTSSSTEASPDLTSEVN